MKARAGAVCVPNPVSLYPRIQLTGGDAILKRCYVLLRLLQVLQDYLENQTPYRRKRSNNYFCTSQQAPAVLPHKRPFLWFT